MALCHLCEYHKNKLIKKGNRGKKMIFSPIMMKTYKKERTGKQKLKFICVC